MEMITPSDYEYRGWYVDELESEEPRKIVHMIGQFIPDMKEYAYDYGLSVYICNKKNTKHVCISYMKDNCTLAMDKINDVIKFLNTK